MAHGRAVSLSAGRRRALAPSTSWPPAPRADTALGPPPAGRHPPTVEATAGGQVQVMTAHHPAKPTPQRGRPKRPRDASRVRVLTLRVPEELLRRLDAYTAQVQAAQPYLR
jgi:hypothetical protein